VVQYIFKIVNHDTEMGLVVPESSMKYALQAWKKRRYYSVVIKPDQATVPGSAAMSRILSLVGSKPDL